MFSITRSYPATCNQMCWLDNGGLCSNVKHSLVSQRRHHLLTIWYTKVLLQTECFPMYSSVYRELRDRRSGITKSACGCPAAPVGLVLISLTLFFMNPQRSMVMFFILHQSPPHNVFLRMSLVLTNGWTSKAEPLRVSVQHPNPVLHM